MVADACGLDDPTSVARLALTCRAMRAAMGDGIQLSRRYDDALRREIAAAACPRVATLERYGDTIALSIHWTLAWGTTTAFAAAYVETNRARYPYTSVRTYDSNAWRNLASRACDADLSHDCYADAHLSYGDHDYAMTIVDSSYNAVHVKHMWRGGGARYDRLHRMSRDCAIEAYLAVTTPYAHRLRMLTSARSSRDW